MRRIFYLMSGPAHLPYLVTSLRTLRNHWDGPVTVFAWPESWEITSRIARDSRLAIQVLLREPEYRGKNDQFLDKIEVAKSLPIEDVAIYLDADTTIHGSLDSLFFGAEEKWFCATQFCDWRSSWSIPRGRIRTLLEFPKIPAGLVNLVSREPFPSVNGGVWACRPDSLVLFKWSEWTWEARSTFIADEKVLHLMQAAFDIRVLESGRWNCSPMEKFTPKTIEKSDVIVWHYHGDSNVRPDKSQAGNALWWFLFENCLRENVGGVSDWWRSVGNKWIDRLVEKNPKLGNV